MKTPERELTPQEQEFIGVLRERYFLFPRKTVIGAVIGFLIATGLVSWGSAKAALETAVAKQATDEIIGLRDQARHHVAGLGAGTYIRVGTPARLQSKKHPKFFLQSHTPSGPTSSVDAASNAGREFIVWNIENVSPTP